MKVIQSMIQNIGFSTRRLENKTKPDPTILREEKIRRLKIEKECENRLKTIELMEVSGNQAV